MPLGLEAGSCRQPVSPLGSVRVEMSAGSLAWQAGIVVETVAAVSSDISEYRHIAWQQHWSVIGSALAGCLHDIP